jgi:hypothetical protein
MPENFRTSQLGFEGYFNIKGYKFLIRCSRSVNLERFDRRECMTSEVELDYIGDHLFTLPQFPRIAFWQECS